MPPTPSSQPHGTMPDGRPVTIHTLTNQHGLKAKVTEYGATLVSLETPDRYGNFADITLGFDTFDGWLNNTPCFGSTIGRFANRINDGKFHLDGTRYTLSNNNAPAGIPCHLHGGLNGFHKVLWSGKIIAPNSVIYTYLSHDGEEGYPGNLTVAVTYTLSDENELIWVAKATTDAPTIINIANHSYWNLSGDPNQTINNHLLTLHAAHYLPTNLGLIPSGLISTVIGTPLDFTSAKTIGERIDADFDPLKIANGYDHCFILDETNEIKNAAKLQDPSSGRIMEILTNQPAIQLYTANFLDGSSTGKNGVPYRARTAVCLETQNFPDAPNHPHFPSAILKQGETYHHTMIHRFSTI